VLPPALHVWFPGGRRDQIEEATLGITSHGSAVAVVTGGNRGIGLELCRQLAEDGYTVVLGSCDVRRGQAAAAWLGHPSVYVRQLDVADEASVDAAAEWVSQQLGRCDVLINNAAIDYDTDALASDADLDRVHRALETNLFGTWRTTLGFLPLLRQSRHARIVNVSSRSGSLASMGAGTPGYQISKAALNALTRTLAAELKSARILVNAVCPGWTNTDMGGGGRPVRDGAASVMWAVRLPDNGPTGGFFRDGQPLPW
jgi:NAD(P)-dependent dehydrogenase (short-subunit alcohol dehydrogenase family)